MKLWISLVVVLAMQAVWPAPAAAQAPPLAVQAQAGKKLTTTQAAELAERIARMRAALGCA